MSLTEKQSKNNFYSYLWHALFLALASNFIDVDTIIPSMVIDAGGSALQVGILTAIMLGGSSFAQLFFTPFLSNKSRKKNFLLFGINLRVFALLGLGFLLYWFTENDKNTSVIYIIFILISLFSVSGAFAGIGYSDILARSIFEHKRKPFLSLRQAISSVGIMLSAYFASYILVSFDYPLNYSWLFIIAGIMLTIASLGFWNIKEMEGPRVFIGNSRNYLSIIVKEIKENKRLANYLLLVNTLGVSLALLPFIILYAKEIFDINNSDVGRFLILKVIAGVISGTLLFYYSKRIKYSTLLYATSFIALLIPITLLINSSPGILGLFFFLGGIMYTFYKIAIDGVLLEISDHKNRTIYIGLVGAGNILPAIFPIFSGWLIPNFGFNYFFLLFIVIILFSVYFIKCLKCEK
jgi:MFS family permease